MQNMEILFRFPCLCIKIVELHVCIMAWRIELSDEAIAFHLFSSTVVVARQ